LSFNSWKQNIADTYYILRYSIANVYAANFKLKKVENVFKIGGVDLSKPLGALKKSVVGLDVSGRPPKENLKDY
jgi:hypothetical protein